jgi:hypothetical protein
MIFVASRVGAGVRGRTRGGGGSGKTRDFG